MREFDGATGRGQELCKASCNRIFKRSKAKGKEQRSSSLNRLKWEKIILLLRNQKKRQGERERKQKEKKALIQSQYKRRHVM